MATWVRRWSPDLSEILLYILATPICLRGPHCPTHLWTMAYAVLLSWSAFLQLAHLTKVNSTFNSQLKLLCEAFADPAGRLGVGGGLLCFLWVLDYSPATYTILG